MSNYTSKGYTTPTGVNSREAVRQWQQRLGVTADGIWGKNTEAAYRKWRLGGGTGGAATTGGASLSGSAGQKTTARQKNTAGTATGLRGLLEGIVPSLTKGKTTTNPLSTPKQSYAVMSVNGIGAQYANGKPAAKQTAATKKTVPKPQQEWSMHSLGVNGIGAQVNGQRQTNTAPKTTKFIPMPEYAWPMHGNGAGGIGGQMHAEEIAAAAEEKKQKQQQYVTNPNPYTGKNNNYGALGGWRGCNIKATS